MHAPFLALALFLTPLFLSSACAWADAAPSASTGIASRAARPKALIIGIDGLRPDALLSAHAPNLRALIRDGAFASDASADSITISGPGWASILTGVWHGKNHVYDNGINAFNRQAYPVFFTRIKEARPDLRTACIVNWPPIRDKLMYGSGADPALAPEDDDSVAAQAATLLRQGDPDVLFLHFDAPDHAGHRYGFSRFSPPYLYAVERTDRRIGMVLEALRARAGARPMAAAYSAGAAVPSKAEDWLILCTTDHGGSWRSHGRNIPSHRRVFLIVSGEDALKGSLMANASLVDLAPTVMAHMGIAVKPEWGWEGRAVGLKPESIAEAKSGS